MVRGGLGVPDFELYYLVAQLQWLSGWLNGKNTEEIGNLDDGGRHGVLMKYILGINRPARRGNRLLSTALRCWDKCCKLTYDTPRYATALPLMGFPFGLGRGLRYLTDNETNTWAEVGIRTVGDLFRDHSLIHLDQLLESTGLHAGQFLNYRALTKSFGTLWKLGTNEPEQHEVLQVMLIMGSGRHLITWLYRALNGLVHKPRLASRTSWEMDMELQLTDGEWDQSLEQIKKISRNTRLKFTHFNYVHQTYLSPIRITRMFGGDPRPCPRCQELGASFYHMVWKCTVIAGYWSLVLQHLNMVLNRGLQPSPRVCLLGIYRRPKKKKVGNRFLDLGLAVAKKEIARNWKSVHAPKLETWKLEVERWARAEEEALTREEASGMRRQRLSDSWRTVLGAFIDPESGATTTSDEEENRNGE